MRGDRNKQHKREQEQNTAATEVIKGVRLIDIGDDKPKRIPRLGWRECIKKVWEVDPLTWPKCGTEMRIISFIIDKAVLQKNLTHLGVFEQNRNRGRRRHPRNDRARHSRLSLMSFNCVTHSAFPVIGGSPWHAQWR
jgi:hypothetical protein